MIIVMTPRQLEKMRAKYLPLSAEQAMTRWEGLMDPDGLVYPCGWMEHSGWCTRLARAAGIRNPKSNWYDGEGVLGERRWAKISGGDVWMLGLPMWNKNYKDFVVTPTRAQFDTGLEILSYRYKHAQPAFKDRHKLALENWVNRYGDGGYAYTE